MKSYHHGFNDRTPICIFLNKIGLKKIQFVMMGRQSLFFLRPSIIRRTKKENTVKLSFRSLNTFPTKILCSILDDFLFFQLRIF